MFNKTFFIGILIGATISTIFGGYARAFGFSIAMYIKEGSYTSYYERISYYSFSYEDNILCLTDGKQKDCVPLVDSK